MLEREHYDFLWRRDTNTSSRIGQLPLAELSTYDGRVFGSYERSRASFNEHFWDFARGWLWGSDPGGVTAYDWNTGAEVALFKSCDPNNSYCSGPETRFTFSSDNTKVVIYTVVDSYWGGKHALLLYDIASHEGIAVNVQGFASPYIPLADYHSVALSPDNRYLVAGYDALRVWDIQNLPPNFEDRLPIYRYAGPEALIRSVSFSDLSIIETKSDDVVQHWDLHTGAFIP